MNCELCENNLESYLEGTLPRDTRDLVKAHLETCKECSRSYYATKIANVVIADEKSLTSNPFLVTRIMAGIENEQGIPVHLQHQPLYKRLITPLILGASIILAIGIGIMQGSIYNVPEPELPVELVYLNDAALESVNAFTNP